MFGFGISMQQRKQSMAQSLPNECAHAIKAFKLGAEAARAASKANPCETPASLKAAKSMIWSLMATPPRRACSALTRRQTAKGKF
jgi:hypothetical protein